jgi:hypothetical protein
VSYSRARSSLLRSTRFSFLIEKKYHSAITSTNKIGKIQKYIPERTCRGAAVTSESAHSKRLMPYLTLRLPEFVSSKFTASEREWKSGTQGSKACQKHCERARLYRLPEAPRPRKWAEPTGIIN